MLKLRKVALLGTVALATCSLSAQSSQAAFNAYRQQLLQGYQDYRKSILENYDKYLEGIWEQHEQFKAGKRFEKPKPQVQPSVASEPQPEPEPQPVATPPAPTIPEPEPPTTPVVTRTSSVTPGLPSPVIANRPAAPNQVNVPRHIDVPEVTPTQANHPGLPAGPKTERPDAPNQVNVPRHIDVPEVTPTQANHPGLPAGPKTERPDAPNQVNVPRHIDVPEVTPTQASHPGLPQYSPAGSPAVPEFTLIPRFTPEEVAEDHYEFEYRGMPLQIANVSMDLKGHMSTPADFAAKWREFKNTDAVALSEAMVEVAKRYNLNDFLTYDVLKAYVLARYPNAHPTAQLALVHFVLANMGYDARLGIDDSGEPFLLIPFNQKVYARHYLTINGRQYYVFPIDSDDPNNHARGYISTCKLPDDVDAGHTFDLILNDLRLPENPKEFSISQGGMTITGTVNENLIPVLYRYPQMATEDFASSNVSPQLRQEVVNQFKEQLAANGKTGRAAIDALLRFTQSGFQYATDDQYHGFEKPYFFEETLYYPKCDCEDRSIFYTYLLWNVLGVENHLIAYPIHEAAAVALEEPISGDNYQHDGKTFYISDPTYIGSRTGQCMPRFKTTAPKIDKEYR